MTVALPVCMHASHGRLWTAGVRKRDWFKEGLLPPPPPACLPTRCPPGATLHLASAAYAGKPLPEMDHTAQFGTVDPLVAAVTRTMGAQGVKPLSLELQEEVGGWVGML